MRTMPENDMPKNDELTINCTYRGAPGNDVEVREIALGAKPMILIESEYDEGTDALAFHIDTTALDQEGLVNILQLLADAIENGEEIDDEQLFEDKPLVGED